MLCFLFQKMLISSAVEKGFVIGLIGNQLISLEFAEEALYMKKGKNDNRWRLRGKPPEKIISKSKHGMTEIFTHSVTTCK